MLAHSQHVIFLNKIGGQIFDFGPNFFEIGEVWSTFSAFSESSWRELQSLKISWKTTKERRSYRAESISVDSQPTY